MPTVAKQGFKPARAGGVLGRIASVSSHTSGIKMCVYGQSKTGKTRLASTFPKPSLLIGLEDGTKSVRSVKGLDFVKLEHSTELKDIIEMLCAGKYKSAILDTAGGLQDMILKEILGLEELPVQKNWGFAKREDWATCGMQIKKHLQALLSLADMDIADVVIIAHERNFGDEAQSDLIRPTVGAALTPSVTAWLNGACDYIGQMFKREIVTETTTKIAGKDVKMKKPTGEIEYALRIGPHPVYTTGFRADGRAEDLPDSIADPDYEKIVSVIRGEKL